MNLDEALRSGDFNDVRAWIRNATDAELDAFIDRSQLNTFFTFATAERQRRQHITLRRPHWTVVPTFWLVIAGVIFAACAGVISWLAWKHPTQANVPPSPASSPSAVTSPPAQETQSPISTAAPSP